MTIVTNNLTNLDNTYVKIVVLLDLSAALDTIDHNLLIPRLANIGIAGNTLICITSYISDPTSSILKIHISSPRNIMYGVPQGSVLEMILLIIYLLHILNIISQFQFPLISVHSYVYYIQLNVKYTSDLNLFQI